MILERRNNGVNVGACEPASGSSITAMVPARGTATGWALRSQVAEQIAHMLTAMVRSPYVAKGHAEYCRADFDLRAVSHQRGILAVRVCWLSLLAL